MDFCPSGRPRSGVWGPRSKLEQAEEAYKLFDTQTTGKAVILPA